MNPKFKELCGDFEYPILLQGGHFTIEEMQERYDKEEYGTVCAVDHVWIQYKVLSEIELMGLDIEFDKTPVYGYIIHNTRPKGVVAKATGVWFN